MVTHEQRYTQQHPCPICGGNGSEHPHCHGFISDGGEWARCTRSDGTDGAVLDEKCSPSAYKYHREDGGSYRAWTKTPPMGQTPRTKAISAPTRNVPKADTKTHPRLASRRVYAYSDTEGIEAVRDVVGGKKQCYPRVRDDTGAPWRDGTGIAPKERIYHRADLTARPDEPVHVVEGEECVEALSEAGVLAISWRGGSGQVRQAIPQIVAAVRGRDVVLLPDADDPGRSAMRDIAMAVRDVAHTVRVVNLYDDESGRDIEDWLYKGHLVDELLVLVAATPAYEPPDADGLDALPDPSPDGWQPVADSWPAPLGEEAFHGLAGKIVRTIAPHTEADNGALLMQLLIALGDCIGRSPYFMAEADHHGLNLFGVLVGETAKGRKGTSWGHIRRIFERVDPEWMTRVVDGLSSGEGLIEEVRDPRHDPKDGSVIEQGATDKRLLIQSPEFAAVLQVQRRDATTLPSVLRNAWDGNTLRVMTRKNPLTATGAHVAIIGHITRDELLRLTDDTSATNGYLNRFMWFAVRRSQYLPFGGKLSDTDLFPLIQRLTDVVAFARTMGEMRRDAEADALWAEVYPDLTEPGTGMVGAIMGRAEPIVMRLACLYALLDTSNVIHASHLLAALAVWAYSAESVKWIFGDRLGDPMADEVLRVLRITPDGMTRTQINDHFGGHRQAKRITTALRMLEGQRMARCVREETAGRPVERWFASRGVK